MILFESLLVCFCCGLGFCLRSRFFSRSCALGVWDTDLMSESAILKYALTDRDNLAFLVRIGVDWKHISLHRLPGD